MTQAPTLNAFGGVPTKTDFEYTTAMELSSTLLMHALLREHPHIIHKLRTAAAAKTTRA